MCACWLTVVFASNVCDKHVFAMWNSQFNDLNWAHSLRKLFVKLAQWVQIGSHCNGIHRIYSSGNTVVVVVMLMLMLPFVAFFSLYMSFPCESVCIVSMLGAMKLQGHNPRHSCAPFPEFIAFSPAKRKSLDLMWVKWVNNNQPTCILNCLERAQWEFKICIRKTIDERLHLNNQIKQMEKDKSNGAVKWSWT